MELANPAVISINRNLRLFFIRLIKNSILPRDNLSYALEHVAEGRFVRLTIVPLKGRVS